MKSRIPRELQDAWRTAGYWRDISLNDAFDAAADRRPDALLTIHGPAGAMNIRLRDLRDQGRKLAGALHACGVNHGDVVAILLPNGIATALAYQAAATLGCVILPIVPIYGAHELSFVLRDSGAKLLFVPNNWRHTNFLDRVRALENVPALATVVVVGEGDCGEFLSWDSFVQRGGDFPRQASGCDDPAFMVYTSGTTANPKGVLHSANSLLAEVYQSYPDDDPDSRVMSPYPAGHVAGALGVLAHSVAARRVVLFDTFDGEAAVRYIASEGITHTSGTPFHYLALLDAADAAGCSVDSLRACGTGGATVPESLVARAERAGIHLFRRYGMSEHPTVTQGADDEPLQLRMTTDGRVRPGVEIRIIDDHGIDCQTGQDGEVVTRGPDMFMGYSDPLLDEQAWLPGGWFLSGDIGRIGAEGHLSITDRKKDIVIRGGENISSRDVEELLLRMDGVREAAVVGYPDERLGERICAYLIVADGVMITIEDVNAAFRQFGAARQKTPERIVLARDLPRTAAGKIRKADLRSVQRDWAH